MPMKSKVDEHCEAAGAVTEVREQSASVSEDRGCSGLYSSALISST